MKKLNFYSIYLSTKNTEHTLYSFGVICLTLTAQILSVVKHDSSNLQEILVETYNMGHLELNPEYKQSEISSILDRTEVAELLLSGCALCVFDINFSRKDYLGDSDHLVFIDNKGEILRIAK